jgi:DNA polymerase III epsilon subunit-like protein
MHGTDWSLLNTETAGIGSNVFVVDIAAQRMCGWERVGEPFWRLLNHNKDIPPAASRVHRYTREDLERDGEPPEQVYAVLREYVRDLPVVGYDVGRVWDNELVPEWRKLGIAPIGSRGFCALRLAQRLLDPIPAGICKLQTLRQYYRLPGRATNSALGVVDTLADLFLVVLKPKAEALGLDSWEELRDYATEEWYPSRFAFGKFKGHTLYEAVENAEIRKWLEHLSGSKNSANARIGAWYLTRLKQQGDNPPIVDVRIPAEEASGFVCEVVIYREPQIEELQTLVEAAQARLAEVEAAFSIEKRKVDVLRAKLFTKLREDYERRDRLRLIVRYRKSFIEKLLHDGEEEAAKVREQFGQAEAETTREYESAAAEVAKKKELSAAEELELKALWKKLVKLFHPDRVHDDPEKRETYHKLTQAINQAKDKGDLETLREIASDPEAFIRKQGWASVKLDADKEIKALRRLLEMLQLKIAEVIEATGRLRESSDYELYEISQRDASILDRVSEKHKQDIDRECADLSGEAQELEKQIEELTEEPAFGSVTM